MLVGVPPTTIGRHGTSASYIVSWYLRKHSGVLLPLLLYYLPFRLSVVLIHVSTYLTHSFRVSPGQSSTLPCSSIPSRFHLLHSTKTVDIFAGHGLSMETHIGRVEVKNCSISNNFGNGLRAKFVDGHFIVVDELLTFCRMANIGKQTFPQMITGIPTFSTSCERVRFYLVLPSGFIAARRSNSF